MNVYVYQADLWCEDCAIDVMTDIRRDHPEKEPEDPDDDVMFDSDDWPKGPYADGGGESDYPSHCAECGCFLENPLTDDGYAYVRQAVADAIRNGRTDSVAVTEWAPFYDIDVDEEEED